MQKDVLITESGGEVTAELLCDIDHHTAKGIREKIDAALASGRAISLILDFSAVGFMDSSGIGLIIGRAEYASRFSIPVKVTGVGHEIMRLIRLSGIERIKNLYIL